MPNLWRRYTGRQRFRHSIVGEGVLLHQRQEGMNMDRSTWWREKRREAVQRMDTLFAPGYDREWGAIAPTHRRMFERFLDRCPPQGRILDAACGTGKYWPLILARGLTVLGMDQSAGMLANARAKFPEVPVEQMGLQELRYREAFDGVACMDAMEFVFPEDWLPVLDNFHRALRPAAYLYFTVEIAAAGEVEAAFAAAQRLRLPVVYGESAAEPGYHYYPTEEQVEEWLRLARFRLVEEAVGDEYHHFLGVKR
jgi:SAM-dependent methyltransferase